MADEINNEDLEPVEPVIPPTEHNGPTDIIGGIVDPETGDTEIGGWR